MKISIDGSVCSRCTRKPCLRMTWGSGRPRPVLYNYFDGVPRECPALASHLFSRMDRQALEDALGENEHVLRNILCELTPMPALVFRTGRERLQAAVDAVLSKKILLLFVPWGSAAYRHVEKMAQAKHKAWATARRKVIEVEEAVLALQAEEEKPKPELVGSAWFMPEKSRTGPEQETESAAPLETIGCKVDTSGLMPGEQILFHVFLKGKAGAVDVKLDTVVGRLGEKAASDTACVHFLIPQHKGGQALESGRVLYFLGRYAKLGLEIKSPPLRLQGSQEEGLRFDLAIDPKEAHVHGDVFVLKGLDSEYSLTRTVKDDRIPGDDRFTLLFPGVGEGKRYALSQVHQDEDAVLVPEVVYRAGPSSSASPQGARRPAHVVGIKAVFRECRLLGETKDLWDRRDTEYPFQLDFVKDKWVYVFGGPPGGAMSLINEYLGTQEGRFRAVDLGKGRGQDRRNPVSAAMDWLTLPLKVGEQKLELYACLSPIQLLWKRVAALEEDPKARCYRIGDGVGGVCWMPDKAAAEIRNLLKTKDPRIENPGEDVVLFGLIDYLHEARRRAEQYQEHVKPYLESRFDHPRPGETTEQMDARRRKKYVAGILKVLVDTSPDKARLRRKLKGGGKELDDFLLSENSREVELKCKAEACGAALVKWMHHPAKGFETALKDYTFDPHREDLWDEAVEHYAFLIQYFDVTSLTRLYGRKIRADEDAWVNNHFLSDDSFNATRKTTQAANEVLAWLGRVVVQSNSFEVETLEKMYGVYFPGIKFEWVKYKSASLATESVEIFHKETDALQQGRKVYFHALEEPGLRQELQVLRISKSCKPLEKMGHITESKLTKLILGGIESWNVCLAINQFYEKASGESFVGLAGSGIDAVNFVLETIKFGGRQIGRGILSTLGALSGGIDAFTAVKGAQKEFREGDYDAMGAQVTVATGSASIAVGSAMVAYTVYTAMSGGLLWAGEGISLTGAGAPVGAVLVLAGMTAQAAGSVVYYFVNITPIEAWIENCPLGEVQEWDFIQVSKAREKIRSLHSILYPYTLEVQHQYLTRDSGYVLAIKGTFNPRTQVTLRNFSLIDKDDRMLPVFQGEVLGDGPGKPYRLTFVPGDPTALYVKIDDSWCWDQHRKNHPGAPNGFVACELEIEIDVNGDGEVLWRGDFKGPNKRMEIQ